MQLIDLDRTQAIVFSTTVPARNVVELFYAALDENERNRARRFRFERDAGLFVTAHALLRYVLWRVTGSADWQFSLNPYGKPELDPAFGEPRLRFNSSHSNVVAACAICLEHDIGVDVEKIDDDFRFDEVTDQVLTRRERLQLESFSAAARREAFLRFWTMKESVVKAKGQGLSLSPRSFEVGFQPLSLSSDTDGSMTLDRWHIEQREIVTRHWACIAIHRPRALAMSI